MKDATTVLKSCIASTQKQKIREDFLPTNAIAYERVKTLILHAQKTNETEEIRSSRTELLENISQISSNWQCGHVNYEQMFWAAISPMAYM